MGTGKITYLTLSQEDLIQAGAFDIPMAIRALKEGLFKYRDTRILFPDKIVQIFSEETQERINCLPLCWTRRSAGSNGSPFFLPIPTVSGCRIFLPSLYFPKSRRVSPFALWTEHSVRICVQPPWALLRQLFCPGRTVRPLALSEPGSRPKCTCSA